MKEEVEEKVAEERRGRTSPISCPGSELSSTNLDRSPIAYFAEIRKLDSGRARIEEKSILQFKLSCQEGVCVLTNIAK